MKHFPLFVWSLGALMLGTLVVPSLFGVWENVFPYAFLVGLLLFFGLHPTTLWTGIFIALGAEGVGLYPLGTLAIPFALSFGVLLFLKRFVNVKPLSVPGRTISESATSLGIGLILLPLFHLFSVGASRALYGFGQTIGDIGVSILSIRTGLIGLAMLAAAWGMLVCFNSFAARTTA